MQLGSGHQTCEAPRWSDCCGPTCNRLEPVTGHSPGTDLGRRTRKRSSKPRSRSLHGLRVCGGEASRRDWEETAANNQTNRPPEEVRRGRREGGGRGGRRECGGRALLAPPPPPPNIMENAENLLCSQHYSYVKCSK